MDVSCQYHEVMNTLPVIHFFRRRILKCQKGVTLVEILVTALIISILVGIVGPRVSGFLSNKRENLVIFTGIIKKVFDDAFLNDKVNYLVIHLSDSTLSESDDEDESNLLSRDNGISVANLVDGRFVESTRKLFTHKKFPDSFRIDEVVINTGETITSGNVIVPFYPQGYSDNVIIHLIINDEERISVRIYKQLKEPEIEKGYTFFDRI
jgi:prepilin-type N-terminal cleavage/methylation domain-containing protein